jgi:hypothetical protein
MNDFTVGARVMVKLSGGRIVEATIKAIGQHTDGIRLQVSFGNETALIYLRQVGEDRLKVIVKRSGARRCFRLLLLC